MEESSSSAGLTSLDTVTTAESDTHSSAVAPILQGHVFKQSTHGIGAKMGLLSFKKRYFVLYDGLIMYYEHESGYKKDAHLVSQCTHT